MKTKTPLLALTAAAVLAATGYATSSGGSDPLGSAIASDVRSAEEKARDAWRHPRETLEFFGLAPGQTIVELTPGSGWYTKILAPYAKNTGGSYVAAGFDPTDSSRSYYKPAVERFQKNFVEKPEVYGDVKVTVLHPNSPGIAPDGSADLVLTFRNVHNWAASDFAAKAFADSFRALKPGGILGVTDHRLPEGKPRPEKLATGYIHESETIALAKAAGFELVGRSDINNNPKDTADHPFGVWTLPPSLRNAGRGEDPNPDFDQTKYKAIGESDRFTLKFRKPS